MKYSQLDEFYLIHERQEDKDSKYYKTDTLIFSLYHGIDLVLRFSVGDRDNWKNEIEEILHFLKREATNIQKIRYSPFHQYIEIITKSSTNIIIFLETSIPRKYQSYFEIVEDRYK